MDSVYKIRLTSCILAMSLGLVIHFY